MIWIVVALLICFAGVLLYGAPYLPTLKKQQRTALQLLDLKKGQTLLELGCGDGRVLRAAAQKGIKGVGYELNPIMFVVAKIVTWRYRRLVVVKFGDYWRVDWPQADGIYVFLLDRFMERLDKKITQSTPGKVKLVSYAFKVPNREYLKQQDGLFLYEYK